MDLVVVCISLFFETVLEDMADGWVALLIVMRLWKVVAFIFDICLADDEDSERDEKIVGRKVKPGKRKLASITGKLSHASDQEGWRQRLGECMESPAVSGVIIILIFVDLGCTLVNDICENTNLVNPVYDEQKESAARITHTICVTVLCIFFLEQILYLVAFGKNFFTKPWFVMDLVVVTISLVCETVLEDVAKGWVALLIVLRLWKIVAFIFDMCLGENESAERDEMMERNRALDPFLSDPKSLQKSTNAIGRRDIQLKPLASVASRGKDPDVGGVSADQQRRICC
jgi:hypothetical protein